MPPDLPLLSTLIGSNYPCLVLIFMVPKVFEPMKFYCIYLVVLEGEQVSFCICKCCLPEKILDILVVLIYYAIIHASLMRSVHYSLPKQG